MQFGSVDGTEYVMLTARPSLADVETGMDAEQGQMGKASAGDVKRLNELVATSVIWQHDNLFEISPKLSYPRPEMVSADPKFWKPAPAAKAAPKKAE